MYLESHSTMWEWFLLFYFTIRLVVLRSKVSVSRQVYLHVLQHLIHVNDAVPTSERKGWLDETYNVLTTWKVCNYYSSTNGSQCEHCRDVWELRCEWDQLGSLSPSPPRSWGWVRSPQHRPRSVHIMCPHLPPLQLYISSYLRHVPIHYWTEVRVEDSEHPGTGIQVGLKQFPSLQSLVRSTWMLNILTDLICTPKLLPMSR